jgi:hypothetical protein
MKFRLTVLEMLGLLGLDSPLVVGPRLRYLRIKGYIR